MWEGTFYQAGLVRYLCLNACILYIATSIPKAKIFLMHPTLNSGVEVLLSLLAIKENVLYLKLHNFSENILSYFITLRFFFFFFFKELSQEWRKKLYLLRHEPHIGIRNGMMLKLPENYKKKNFWWAKLKAKV